MLLTLELHKVWPKAASASISNLSLLPAAAKRWHDANPQQFWPGRHRHSCATSTLKKMSAVLQWPIFADCPLTDTAKVTCTLAPTYNDSGTLPTSFFDCNHKRWQTSFYNDSGILPTSFFHFPYCLSLHEIVERAVNVLLSSKKTVDRAPSPNQPKTL